MRVPRGLWLDRLLKVREAGFNAIQVNIQLEFREKHQVLLNLFVKN